MALTGKTIGQLTYLSGLTSNTLFPVELDGNTYHVMYSAFTSSNFTQLTYDELYSQYTGGTMMGGTYYLISDYQTCYDQPNFDNNGNPITTGNYKTGSTEPLLVFATSPSTLSPMAFSIQYPKDLIKYDITFNQTEVTNSPAKGRITERIDEKNNRADYDFRAVQFIRYQAFYSEQYLNGKVSLDGLGNVVGVNTTFLSNFSTGNIIGIYNPYNSLIGSFAYYEVVNVIDDTNMVVSGTTYFSINDTYYSYGENGGQRSPYQCNITSVDYTGFTEYYTFNDGENFNTYLGDNVNYDTFILSNNVFLNGEYQNNKFGINVVGNTFDDDMDNNMIGSYCQYNIITNDFDRNTIGNYFIKNYIIPDMAQNLIGDYFELNMIGDYDGYDFDNNRVGENFSRNFLTFSNDDFRNNVIGNSFYENVVDGGFLNNTIIGQFYRNDIVQDFSNNTIGYDFYNNIIKYNFTNNTIGEMCYNNQIYSGFLRNTIGKDVYGNIFGDPQNIGIYYFADNNVGSFFSNNTFSGNTFSNTIGSNCQSNNLANDFSYNQIGDNFQSNTTSSQFGFDGNIPRGNILGNGFRFNTITASFYDNTFGDSCANSIINSFFSNNKVSNGSQLTVNDLDNFNSCLNNTFTFGNYVVDLTLSGGTGGNPIIYSQYTTNVVMDAADNTVKVTFLSGGTFTVQSIIV